MRFVALLLASSVMLLAACTTDEWPSKASPSPSITSDLPSGAPVVMNSFEDFTDDFRLPAGTYRVRYSARGLDRARDAEYDDPYLAGNTLPGRHLFQFWPAEAAPDEILRGESETAASARAYHTERR